MNAHTNVSLCKLDDSGRSLNSNVHARCADVCEENHFFHCSKLISVAPPNTLFNCECACTHREPPLKLNLYSRRQYNSPHLKRIGDAARRTLIEHPIPINVLQRKNEGTITRSR